jgi:3-methyladenine DNA glycosylase AlkD
MNARQVLEFLKARRNPKNVEGMARFGITGAKAFGVPAPMLKDLARRIGKNQKLSLQLWKTGIHEARAVAFLIGDPKSVSEAQMESWAKEFRNWAECDGCCLWLFDYTPFAYRKAVAWSKRREEYVKRAGFVLMATRAVHDKDAGDARFEKLLPLLVKGAEDERPMVKKAVNWALRQIGKRSLALNNKAVRTAQEIRALGTPAARWIASDALRELKSPAVLKRLKAKEDRRRSGESSRSAGRIRKRS